MTEIAEAATRRLFVVAGIDGAGKSTALRRISALRPSWAVGSYDPEDWLPHPELPHLDRWLDRHPREEAAYLSPEARSGFIADLLAEHWRVWGRPHLESGRVVLLDSYHFRFRAKALLRGDPTAGLEAVVGALPRPRAVLLLDLEPEQAARRRLEFDLQECDGEPGADNFVSFQRRQTVLLRDLCQQGCDDVTAVDGRRASGEIAERLVEAVEARL